MWGAIVSAYGRRFWAAGIIKFFHDIVMFLTPFILELLLKSLSSNAPRQETFLLALAMLGSTALDTLSVNTYFHILFRISLHMKVRGCSSCAGWRRRGLAGSMLGAVWALQHRSWAVVQEALLVHCGVLGVPGCASAQQPDTSSTCQ